MVVSIIFDNKIGRIKGVYSSREIAIDTLRKTYYECGGITVVGDSGPYVAANGDSYSIEDYCVEDHL